MSGVEFDQVYLSFFILEPARLSKPASQARGLAGISNNVIASFEFVCKSAHSVKEQNNFMPILKCTQRSSRRCSTEWPGACSSRRIGVGSCHKWWYCNVTASSLMPSSKKAPIPPESPPEMKLQQQFRLERPHNRPKIGFVGIEICYRYVLRSPSIDTGLF